MRQYINGVLFNTKQVVGVYTGISYASGKDMNRLSRLTIFFVFLMLYGLLVACSERSASPGLPQHSAPLGAALIQPTLTPWMPIQPTLLPARQPAVAQSTGRFVVFEGFLRFT